MPWSFSSLTAYEGCPHRLTLSEQKTVREAPSEAQATGLYLHSQFENYLRGEALNPALDPLLSPFIDDCLYDQLIIEEEWGLDRDWRPVPWSSPDLWCRMKLDLCALDRINACVKVYDWKAGKAHPVQHTQQGSLYLLGALAHVPADLYTYEFWYIDPVTLTRTDRMLGPVCTPKQIENLKKSFERRVTKMETNKWRNPKPSKWNCHYCPFKSNCEYNADEPD